MVAWKIHKCRDNMESYIVGRYFWKRLFERLHPDLKDNHTDLWKQEMKQKFYNMIDCWHTTVAGCIDVFTKMSSCCYRHGKVNAYDSETSKGVTLERAADTFATSKSVQKRLDMEVFGDHESSNSNEMKNIIER